MTATAASPQITALLAELKQLRNSCLDMEREFAGAIAEACPQSRPSVQNLIHYLALRRHDLRDLQSRLAALGLSSLGRSESSALAGLESIIAILESLANTEHPDLSPRTAPVDFNSGSALLAAQSDHLLGPSPKGRGVRIMVTMSTEAAESYELVKGLIDAGMDVMRVNCAHDSAPAWERMIAHMRRANKESGKQCRVVMDLAGPKLRTGPLHRGNHVVRWKVSKSARGLVTTPARVILTSRQAQRESLPPSDAMLPVPETLLREARPGDVIRIDDSRGRHRRLTVTEKAAHHCVCACEQSAFILSHAKLSLLREGEKVATGRVGELPFIEEPITLHQHDLLILTRDDGDDHAAARTRRSDRSRNRSRNPPRISCTLPEVFDTAQPGQPIFFDDGKIEGRIRDVQPDGILVEIAHTAPGGSKLGSAKGINLPETDLGIAAMTEKDRQDLDFIAAHADIVGLSFTRRPEDVLELRQELTARNGGHLGIVLKIESGQGFDQLPLIMMAALGHHPVGIMVARGDLAIEVGFERLAELQEEILWLSEAAHMPVIWATQVLETLAKTGVPSRAEVTDAAMGVRAECVMLNKGEHIVEAARFLDHILHKMRAHQIKKRSMLRRLTVAQLNAQPPAAASPVKTHSGIVETSSVQPHG